MQCLDCVVAMCSGVGENHPRVVYHREKGGLTGGLGLFPRRDGVITPKRGDKTTRGGFEGGVVAVWGWFYRHDQPLGASRDWNKHI